MPTPQGNITGSGIWQGQPQDQELPVEEVKDEQETVSTEEVQEG